MIMALLIILILAVLFGKQLKMLIGLFSLLVLFIFLWPYWWGKIFVVLLGALNVLGLISMAYLKVASKNPIHNKKEENREVKTSKEYNEDELRKEAFFYATEDFTNNPNEYTENNLNSYHRWLNNPHSEPEIENWFQENKDYFVKAP
ncbi:phage holin family protein [Pseudobacillus badius]|uniref:phage holin family protein n=1 Tax=Bacillus badius TaxID=1455 RepID=UPI003CF2A93C